MSRTTADLGGPLQDDAERAARGRRFGAAVVVGDSAAAGHEVLTNPRSARVSRVAGLSRRNARAKHRRFLVEGPRGVREAVRHAPDRVLDVYLTEAAVGRHGDIREEAAAAGLHLHVTSERVMDAMSADAQRVLAVVATQRAPGPDALPTPPAGAGRVAVPTEAHDPRPARPLTRAARPAAGDPHRLVRATGAPPAPPAAAPAA